LLIGYGGVRPKFLAESLSADDFAGILEQQFQDLQWFFFGF
jgi:hypothetical protein